MEHRLEFVATVDGVRWINDSKATNVNSCWYALESMPQSRSTVLILGGKDKGNDYSEISARGMTNGEFSALITSSFSAST